MGMQISLRNAIILVPIAAIMLSYDMEMLSKVAAVWSDRILVVKVLGAIYLLAGHFAIIGVILVIFFKPLQPHAQYSPEESWTDAT